jgi:hypothetical protein
MKDRRQQYLDKCRKTNNINFDKLSKIYKKDLYQRFSVFGQFLTGILFAVKDEHYEESNDLDKDSNLEEVWRSDSELVFLDTIFSLNSRNCHSGMFYGNFSYVIETGLKNSLTLNKINTFYALIMFRDVHILLPVEDNSRNELDFLQFLDFLYQELLKCPREAYW